MYGNNEYENGVLQRIARDTAREEFNALVKQGRKWCYYHCADDTVALVVEDHSEYFPLSYKFSRAAGSRYVKDMNKLLGVDINEELRIVNTSMIASQKKYRKRA